MEYYIDKLIIIQIALTQLFKATDHNSEINGNFIEHYLTFIWLIKI